jgi:hypothetical protein
MADSSAKKDVQVTVGKDLSTVTIQGVKVEVSPDSNVVAYTNDGVQTKPAAGEAAAKGTHISEDFNTIVLNGATIERAADGHLVISTPGIVITKPAPANDSAAKAKTAPEIGPEVGDELEDGTILAGFYEGKPLSTTPRDAPGSYTFNEAAKYANNLDANGHHDFHAPSKGELNVLYENRNKGKLAGTFNETGSGSAGWYRSSSQSGDYGAWAQRFSDGSHDDYGKDIASSLRCVR